MIYINDIPSFRAPEDEEIIPDDRLERIETIDNVIVQDLGRIESGDVIALQCLFSPENYARLKALWLSRERVNYTDEEGVVWQSLKLKIQKIKKHKDYPGYKFVTFELWRA